MGITASEFEAAYRAHSRTVLRWARGIMGDRADVEDAAQNAWMEAWRSREAFDGVRPFWAWLRMIVKRACWHMLNPQRKAVETVSDEVVSTSTVEAALVTEGDAERAVDAGRLRAAVGGLQVLVPLKGGFSMYKPASPAIADTLRMALAGEDNSEIAKVRGVSHQSVADTMKKAIAALRRTWGLGT